MARTNPWALVPAADYEAFFGASGVDVFAPLALLFRKIYATCKPRRLLILGIGTGSALEAVDVRATGRVIGVDVNLSFLAVARQRQARLGSTLQLHCAEVERVELPSEEHDLIHAAMVLEYVDLRAVVARVAGWLAPGGVFSAVLELAGEGERSPGMAPQVTIRKLAASRRLVPTDELRALCLAERLVERCAFVVALPTGRRLFVALFDKPNPAAL